MNFKVSFAFPVLNEEKNLDRCLSSIRKQLYPQELVEIVLADGGSTDRTLEIAKKYNCIIINNPYKTAEKGAVLAHKEATGDIKVFFAADNELPSDLWVSCMVRPFKDPKVWGTYSYLHINQWYDIVVGGYNTLNQYYSALQVEPFTWFVYGKASDPQQFTDYYPVEESHKGKYTIFKFTPMNHPLIAFAQGFCIRKEFVRKPEYDGDDVLPVIQMIEEGKKLAFVGLPIYHHHLISFKQYMSKFRQRIRNSSFNKRAKYMSKGRIFRKYLFMLYGLTLICPLYHSIKWWNTRKPLTVPTNLSFYSEKFWLWHFPATVGLAYLILWEVVRKKLRFNKDLTMGNNLSKTFLDVILMALMLSGFALLVAVVAFINVSIDNGVSIIFGDI